MAVDWGEALRIGGTGFGLVFLVLVILAVAITIIGLATRRLNRKQANNEQKGE
ncbi:MAG: OadG family protein [Dehalococcoidales bacterium]|nr:OadG family protein [Dehalococcoidales bacterium]